MIRILKYHELDFRKYDCCIRNAVQYNFQAEKKYLDCLNLHRWQFMVLDDYKAVMPVYFKMKFGFKIVIPPPYINQLGIFSATDDEATNDEFLKIFLKNYRIRYYPFNSKNKFSGLKNRINFRLERQPYEEVKKKYSVHRRRNVRLRDPDLKFHEVELTSKVKLFFMAHVLGMKNERMKDGYFSVLERLAAENLLKIYALSRKDKMVSAAFLSDFPDEMGLLSLINSKTEITANDPSILIDQILQKYISTKNFNFFGSNIAAVAEFYRRFGAQEERYACISNSKTEVVKNLLSVF